MIMKKFNLLLILVVFAGVIFTSCKKEESNETASGIVKYEVTCSTSGFNITYENSSGDTEQETILSDSWTTSFTGQQGDWVYISANTDKENETVTVKIYYQGKVIDQDTSFGAYEAATASGSLP